VLANPAKGDAWQANPEHVDPRYHAMSITHTFDRVCHKAGMTHATFQDLRHTFVTNARRAAIAYLRIMAVIRTEGNGRLQTGSHDRPTGFARGHPSTGHVMDTKATAASEMAAQAAENKGMGR